MPARDHGAGGKGTADDKFAALQDAGVRTVRSLAEIGDALVNIQTLPAGRRPS